MNDISLVNKHPKLQPSPFHPQNSRQLAISRVYLGIYLPYELDYGTLGPSRFAIIGDGYLTPLLFATTQSHLICHHPSGQQGHGVGGEEAAGRHQSPLLVIVWRSFLDDVL